MQFWGERDLYNIGIGSSKLYLVISYWKNTEMEVNKQTIENSTEDCSVSIIVKMIVAKS